MRAKASVGHSQNEEIFFLSHDGYVAPNVSVRVMNYLKFMNSKVPALLLSPAHHLLPAPLSPAARREQYLHALLFVWAAPAATAAAALRLPNTAGFSALLAHLGQVMHVPF